MYLSCSLIIGQTFLLFLHNKQASSSSTVCPVVQAEHCQAKGGLFPIWQLLGWADGPRNLKFKWHQILREELSFGVRGQLEMRCQTWSMMGEVRMERGAQEHTEATEDVIFIDTQNVFCRDWKQKYIKPYYAYVA